MCEGFDVFLSYASTDSVLADPLVQALEAAGVSVWRDTQQIDSFADIQRTIRQGLARSKLLLALYSQAYTRRRACDWELAAAYVAGGRDRILVLNPEDGAGHIQPKSLRENRFANRDDLTDWASIAAKVKARAAEFTSTFGALPKPAPDQKWVGLSPSGGAQTFVGRRAEIWQVHDGLAAGSVLLAPTTAGTAPGDGSTLLRGLGGMGKTLLAEEYARRFAAAWPGGIFWLKANGKLDDQYLLLDQSLGAGSDHDDPSSLKRAVTQAMAARPGAYLWVVDDLPHGLTAEQARAWFAPTNQGRTLVTTRTRTLDSIAQAVELPELEEESAFTLLTLNRKPQGQAEEVTARAIIAALGRQALAVDLARHLVQRQGYAKVLADLRNPSKEALNLAAKLSVELPTGHDKSIAQTFLRSIQLLDDSGLDALRVAAHLAPHTPIPQDLLSAIRAQADGMSRDQADDETVLAVDQAAAHSLCDISVTGYVVHALVCRTMALRYGDDRSQALAQAGQKVLLAAFQRAGDIRNHAALVPLLPHAHAINPAPKTALQANLADWLGRYYLEAGLYTAARQQMFLALKTHSRILGSDHPHTLTSMNNLAITLRAQGEYAEARKLQEQMAESSSRIHGPDHPHTMAITTNLAAILLDQGDFAGARNLEEQVLETSRRILGPDHHQTLASMNNLADTLRRQGEYVRAQNLEEQVVETCLRIHGPDHPGTLTSMNNLANTLWRVGEHARARELEEQVLESRHRILGPDHPDTLTSMNNLASTLRSQGEHARARELETQVLETRLRILGPDHPNTRMSGFMLAQALDPSREGAEALALAAWAAEGVQAALGHDHPYTRMTAKLLADLTARQKYAPGPD